MGRPTPEIIDAVNNHGVRHVTTHAEGLFAVFRDGLPVNFRHEYTNGRAPLYVRTVFVSKGSANKCARTLNELFGSTAYYVVSLVSEET